MLAAWLLKPLSRSGRWPTPFRDASSAKRPRATLTLFILFVLNSWAQFCENQGVSHQLNTLKQFVTRLWFSSELDFNSLIKAYQDWSVMGDHPNVYPSCNIKFWVLVRWATTMPFCLGLINSASEKSNVRSWNLLYSWMYTSSFVDLKMDVTDLSIFLQFFKPVEE